MAGLLVKYSRKTSGLYAFLETLQVCGSFGIHHKKTITLNLSMYVTHENSESLCLSSVVFCLFCFSFSHLAAHYVLCHLTGKMRQWISMNVFLCKIFCNKSMWDLRNKGVNMAWMLNLLCEQCITFPWTPYCVLFDVKIMCTVYVLILVWFVIMEIAWKKCILEYKIMPICHGQKYKYF